MGKYRVSLAALGAVLLGGCSPSLEGGETGADDIYPGVPVLSRTTYVVEVTGEQESCFGMAGTPYPCFSGIKPSGERVQFSDGIAGYTFQSGARETIMIEEIEYDFSSPNAPADASSIRYVLLAK